MAEMIEKAKVTEKIVIIDHRGPIYEKGGVYGPITTPYVESTAAIFRMLSAGIKVLEVLGDDEMVELNVENFDQDFAGKAPAPVAAETTTNTQTTKTDTTTTTQTKETTASPTKGEVKADTPEKK